VTDGASVSSASSALDNANWSEDLESLHEGVSRDHPLEVLTRRRVLEELTDLPDNPVVVELGCSTGYLLDDLQQVARDGLLIGIDLVPSGLEKAHLAVPAASIVQADVCHLPIRGASADALVTSNLLEHIPDDGAALAEIHRVLRPGGLAVVVVPTGPGLYDYYDRFLCHERRYGRGEVARKARRAGLDVVGERSIGVVVYPAFWVAKKLNRLRFDSLDDDALQEKVMADYTATGSSRLFELACRVEEGPLDQVRVLPGVRGLTVLRRSRS